jgi:hypothetical protein
MIRKALVLLLTTYVTFATLSCSNSQGTSSVGVTILKNKDGSQVTYVEKGLSKRIQLKLKNGDKLTPEEIIEVYRETNLTEKELIAIIRKTESYYCLSPRSEEILRKQTTKKIVAATKQKQKYCNKVDLYEIREVCRSVSF